MTLKSHINTGPQPTVKPQHYAKGTRFERKTRDDLEKRGYLVIRAAGSKGAAKVDLVAFRPGWPMMLIQCKTSGAISKVEWDQLFRVSTWYAGATVAILASNGPNGHGCTYEQITGERIRYARIQPCQPYDPGTAADVARVVFRPNGPDSRVGEVDLGPSARLPGERRGAYVPNGTVTTPAP